MTTSNGNIFRVTGPLRGIHRSPVNSLNKGQSRGALMFSLICAWINGWLSNGEAGELRRHRAHYDVSVMLSFFLSDIVFHVQILSPHMVMATRPVALIGAQQVRMHAFGENQCVRPIRFGSAASARENQIRDRVTWHAHSQYCWYDGQESNNNNTISHQFKIRWKNLL